MRIYQALIIVFAVSLLALPVVAAKGPATGALQVFSEKEEVYIYLDGYLKGKNEFIKKDVQVGEHYIKGVQGKKDGPLVFSRIVIVKEGEVRTVVIPANEAQTPVPTTTTTTIATNQAVAVITTEAGTQEERVKLHPSDTVYHRLDAVDITGEGLVITTRSIADKKGYKPCPDCFPKLEKSGTPEASPVTGSQEVTLLDIASKEAGSPEVTTQE